MINFIPKAYAAVDIGSNYKLGDTGNSVTTTFGTLSQLVIPLVQNAFVLSGIIFLILLVFGGITYIMNAGSGNQEQIEKGKNALTWAVLGFIIIFAAFWIVQIIEFVTGVEVFNSGL